MASKLAIVAAVIHGLISMVYLFISFRVSSLYSEIDIPQPNPIARSWPFLVFLTVTILDLIYFWFLRVKSKQGINIKYDWIISLLLLIIPFLVLFSVGIYANMQMSKAIQNSF